MVQPVYHSQSLFKWQNSNMYGGEFMDLDEKKLHALTISISSKEDTIIFLKSLKKQGVPICYKYNRVMIPHETKAKFFVKDVKGQIITGDDGGMGRRTAKNIGEKITELLCIKSKEDFENIWRNLN
jgi:hypothetical protein